MMEGHVSLTQEEEALFSLLLEVVKEMSTQSVLRVAGGWVRDKLLYRESQDIDLVVDNMTGSEFAQHLSVKRPQECSLSNTIQSNPDKHKHTNIATMRILSFKIEICSLLEERQEDSSPENDAKRRDFTINSLFYNINSARVEDLTGLGLEDLKEKRIQTPFSALQTLGTDPLRCIRAVRFAASLGFTIAKNVLEAIQDPQIRTELTHNISRERIITECYKILAGKNPVHAFELMRDLNLLQIIFPPMPETTEEAKQATVASLRIMHSEHFANPQVPIESLTLAALFLPLASSTNTQERLLPFTKHYMREVWLFTKQEVTNTFLLLESVQPFKALLKEFGVHKTLDRLSVGKFIRELGPKWIHVYDLAFVSVQSAEEKDSLLPLFPEFMNQVAAVGFIDDKPVWKLAPLLKGGEVMKLLGMKEGKRIGAIVQEMIEWQLLNPEKGKEECIQWLSQHNK